jgi:hypothetical protein
MTRFASLSPLGSEFDNFLFAPIGEERNGMLLSVISALARSDVDPWQEAAKLALLPGETATQRLASLIAALPDRASAQPDPKTIAARLISLLPHPASFGPSSHTPSRQILRGVGAATNFRAVISLIAINAIFMAFLLGAQSIMASHQPPPQVDKIHTRISATPSSQVPQRVAQQAPRNQTNASAAPGQGPGSVRGPILRN